MRANSTSPTPEPAQRAHFAKSRTGQHGRCTAVQPPGSVFGRFIRLKEAAETEDARPSEPRRRAGSDAFIVRALMPTVVAKKRSADAAMTRPDFVCRLAVLVCVGCVLPAVMSGCGEAAPLDDSDASMAVAAPRSPESRGSAILELLRDAGGPELARTAALRDAAERMEREAPTEWVAFLMAAEAFRDAAPVVDWTLFLWLFMTAAAEAPITEAEHEAMNAAYEELKAEMDQAEFATKNAVERSNAAAEEARVALQAALEAASEAGSREFRKNAGRRRGDAWGRGATPHGGGGTVGRGGQTVERGGKGGRGKRDSYSCPASNGGSGPRRQARRSVGDTGPSDGD